MSKISYCHIGKVGISGGIGLYGGIMYFWHQPRHLLVELRQKKES